MYVCVCNAISDGQVRQALTAGKRSIGEIRRHLGFRSCCGRCTDHMRAMVDAHGCGAANDCSACVSQAEPVVATL